MGFLSQFLNNQTTNIKEQINEIQFLEWFYLISGLVLITRYYWFLDDAFIYFRYVDNLLFLKIGLVYNHGEFAEGFSSPLWTILLCLIRLTRMNYWLITRLVAYLSFFCFWFMLVKLNRKFSPKMRMINFPLAYLTFCYGVDCYFTSGMETPLVQIIAIVYALYIVNPASLTLQVLLALSPLIRPELTIPLILCLCWTWFYHKKSPLRETLLTVCLVGSYVIFRIYYYADLFPNTFYLKNLVRINQGISYLEDLIETYHITFVIGLFVLLLFLLKKRVSQDTNLNIAPRLMMVITTIPIILYVIKIGGDPRHYRYFAFPFCLIVCASAGVLEHLIEAFNLHKYKLQIPAGIIISLIVFSFYPSLLTNHPFLTNVGHNDFGKHRNLIDAYYNRRQYDFKYEFWSKYVNVEKMLEYRRNNPQFKYIDIKSEARCVYNYIEFNKRIIHYYGLTEPVLARTKMKAVMTAHKAGLEPLAEDLVAIQKSAKKIGKGMYRKAVEEGRAPEWIAKNLDTFEVIERKIYNDHDFWENLKLAFTFPPKIIP